MQQWRKAHLDEARERGRAMQQKRKQQPGYLAYQRDWARKKYHRDVEAARARGRESQKRLHAYRAHYQRMRELRIRSAVGTHTLTEWQEKIALFGGCCAYCGEAKPLTQDHKVPISRGGTNDIGNIVPACRSCNSAKRDKMLDVWARDEKAEHERVSFEDLPLDEQERVLRARMRG